MDWVFKKEGWVEEPDTTEACTECGAVAGQSCLPDCWIREENCRRPPPPTEEE